MSLWGEFSKQLLPSVSSSPSVCTCFSGLANSPSSPEPTHLSVTKLNISVGSSLFGQAMGQLPLHHSTGCHSTIPPLSFFETGSQTVRTMTMQPRMNLTSVCQVSCFYLLNTRMTGRHNHTWFNVVLGSSPGLCAHWARTPPAELHPQLQCPKVHS